MPDDPQHTLADIGPIKPVSAGELRPSLIELAGREFGRQFFLGQETTCLGRSEDTEIHVADARASRRHAIIEPERDPNQKVCGYVIRDLNSRNGTFVNGQRISSAPLHEGDKIQIGHTIFKFALKDTVELEFEDKIYKLATTDPLTGLHTRDYFAKEFTRLFHHCVRYNRPMAVMMVDLDNFKTINDTRGHLAGDRVLQAVAKLLQESLREEDVCGRYGGEEFVALLPETSASAARFPAQRFLAILRRQDIPIPDAAPLRVTASIGIASLPEHGRDETSLLAAADKALYAAKESGKDRVCIASASVAPEAGPEPGTQVTSRVDDLTIQDAAGAEDDPFADDAG